MSCETPLLTLSGTRAVWAKRRGSGLSQSVLLSGSLESCFSYSQKPASILSVDCACSTSPFAEAFSSALASRITCRVEMQMDRRGEGKETLQLHADNSCRHTMQQHREVLSVQVSMDVVMEACTAITITASATTQSGQENTTARIQ